MANHCVRLCPLSRCRLDDRMRIATRSYGTPGVVSVQGGAIQPAGNYSRPPRSRLATGEDPTFRSRLMMGSGREEANRQMETCLGWFVEPKQRGNQRVGLAPSTMCHPFRSVWLPVLLVLLVLADWRMQTTTRKDTIHVQTHARADRGGSVRCGATRVNVRCPANGTGRRHAMCGPWRRIRSPRW